MEQIERINMEKDPKFSRKKQLENVIKGKGTMKDNSTINPCHKILSNYVGSQEKELIKMIPDRNKEW